MFLLFIIINLGFVSGQCPTFSRTSLPVSTRIGPGHKCTNSYPPSNFDYLDVSYVYGQKISQSFYQNGKLIGECPLSKICNKRIQLNPNYGVTIITQRQTAKNAYGTITNGHSINFGRNKLNKLNNIFSDSICNYPPEINVDANEQSGYISSKCVYNYTQTFANTFIIDMDFNDSVTIKVFNSDNFILYMNSSDTFFKEIETDFDEISIIISSNKNIQINWMNMYELYSNSDDSDNINLNDIHSFFVTSIVISILCIICVFGLVSCFVTKIKKIENNKNSAYEQL